MKIGFIALNDLKGLEEDAQFAVRHGFVGLEFNFWSEFKDLNEDTVVEMRKILRRHGAVAASLGLWGWNHISRDDAERKESLRQLERAIKFAEILQASVLITGGGDVPDASLDEKAQRFAEIVYPYVKKARDAGLKVALYPVHGNSFLTGIEAYEALWKYVPDVGIKLDPANIKHSGQDYLEILRKHGGRVFHMHVKEHLYMDGELASQPAAGMGDIEWGKIFAFLYEHNYTGYLIVEPHGPIWSRPPLRRKMLILSQRFLRQFIVED